MNFELEKEKLGFLVTDFEKWEYLKERNFNLDLCIFALDFMNGEIYLLKILEGTKYSVKFAERILPLLYSESILKTFGGMIYNHSQKLFLMSKKRLNIVQKMKEKGMYPKSVEFFNTIPLIVCA